MGRATSQSDEEHEKVGDHVRNNGDDDSCYADKFIRYEIIHEDGGDEGDDDDTPVDADGDVLTEAIVMELATLGLG